VVMGVYRGLAAAGGTWPVTWEAFRRERPEVSDVLEIKWRTPPLPNMAVIVDRNVAEADLAAVAAALFGMHTSEDGRAILGGIGVAGFEPADSATYEPVRRFLRAYARDFGKVPEMEGGGK
jgi:phosphonate transport system substrate-binding protein